MSTAVTDIPRPRFARMRHRSGGFAIEEIGRFGFAAQRFEPSIPHILGRARRA
jgi:hypothetical protein